MTRKIKSWIVIVTTLATMLAMPAANAYTGFCLDTDVFEVWFINLFADPPLHIEAALFGEDPNC